MEMTKWTAKKMILLHIDRAVLSLELGLCRKTSNQLPANVGSKTTVAIPLIKATSSTSLSLINLHFPCLSLPWFKINHQCLQIKPKPQYKGHFLGFLPRRFPIPASGPSRKHNDLGLQSWRSP
ncbi:hypothetical protein J1N35_019679 [Gossypium stocksii]|uniref:Uncharacterized protein n=1 Tax=Gossypium stocksii TaxID=47602 RepID=A0A9D3VB65_9ROSI|nr:hypothetical protein J1N35_019679 [Gossypium stocksii]